MKEVINLYRLFNILSLDVAAGAVIGSLFFAKIFEVVPSIPSLISLGLTVWIIYTTDRLLDARDVVGEAASERHRFHQRHQKKLMLWLVLAMMIGFGLIFFLPTTILKHGAMLSLVVVVYLLLRKHLYISKELLVATLYTIGVLLPVWPSNKISPDDFLFILLFFLIALLNLIVFSWVERKNDIQDKQSSLATIIDEKSIRSVLIGLFVITFSICFYLVLQPAHYVVALIFFVMTIILLSIFLFKYFFIRNGYYRIAGDAIFLLPLIYLLT
jgi:4-hydroxybenzoate polyprenyltransferase